MANAESTSDNFSIRMRDRIRDYLATEGWQVGLKTARGAQWVLTADDRQGRPLTIIHPTPVLGQTDRIVIIAALALDPAHQTEYTNLSAESQRDLIFELRHQIILLGAGYQGIGDPLRLMGFDEVVYFDGLTKNDFLRAVRLVRNAIILARTIIARRFNHPPPPVPERHPIGFQPPEHETT